MTPSRNAASGFSNDRAERDRPSPSDVLTRVLGWASLGLGLPQVLAPRGFCEAIGIEGSDAQQRVVRAVGVRELVAGAGLLRRGRPLWLWARVIGDVLDLALLAAAVKAGDRRGRSRTRGAVAAVASIAAVDLYAAMTRSGRGNRMELTSVVTIRKQPQDVYAFWRRLENLPGFMAHLEEVRILDHHRSNWRASAPFGKSVEWEAEITEDVPGERISWRSAPGADVANTGSVRFTAAPGDRGTEVRVTLVYEPPGRALGAAVTRYFGEEPHQHLDDDLRRLKQVLETGEVVRSEGAPSGKRSREEFPQHPARPLSPKELAKLEPEVAPA